MIVGTFDAKTRFSELLNQVENGEDVIITRRGKPVAKMVRIISEVKNDDSSAMWENIRTIRNSITGFSGSEANELREDGRR